MSSDGQQAPGVLAGVKVIDLTRIMAGPYATLMLGDHGAEVIKVESLPKGDPSRQSGTAFVADESGLFLHWNRNKKSIAVDLRKEQGVQVVLDLIKDADIFVENYRPGVADEIGLSYERLSEINPRLIYCSLSSFGKAGPLAFDPATDSTAQAITGVMSVTGEANRDPVMAGIPIVDFSASMALVQGVLLAMLSRERTGRGQRVDVSLYETTIFALSTRLVSYWYGGQDSTRHGSAHSVTVPYGTYRTADGVVMAGTWSERDWPRFCSVLGLDTLATDSRFLTNRDRARNRDALEEALAPAFAAKTSHEWGVAFRRARVLFAEVNTIADVMNHPQTEALGIVREVQHPTAGALPQAISPVHLSENPTEVQGPPPLLGQHTHELLRAAGYTEARLNELLHAGVIAQSPSSDASLD